MVVNSNRDAEVELGQIRALLAHQVDGIVYAKMYHREVEVPAVLGQLPTVLVDAFDPHSDFPSVVPDEEQIAESATDLLISQGHRAIAHLTIREDSPAKVGRLRGYRRALGRAGIPFDERLVIEAEVERGAAATGIARGRIRQIPGVGKQADRCLLLQRPVCDGRLSGGRDVRAHHSRRPLGRWASTIWRSSPPTSRPGCRPSHFPTTTWGAGRSRVVVAQLKAGPSLRGSDPRTKMQCYLVERDSVAVPSGVPAIPGARRHRLTRPESRSPARGIGSRKDSPRCRGRLLPIRNG